MKNALGIFLFLACTSCSGGSKTAFTLHVEGPKDESCVGVAGFEVTVSSGSQRSQSGSIRGPGPILEPLGCKLNAPFTVEELDPNTPVTISVVGYDGAGRPRVDGEATASLSDGSGTLTLAARAGAAVDILVIDRSKLLGATPLSEVESMEISTVTMGKPVEVISVNRSTAGAYFDVEPAPYGVSSNLTGAELTISFTVDQGSAPPKTKVVVTSAGAYLTVTPR